LFHTENIPDRVVESARFWRVIKVARLCGDEFVCPDRKKLGVNCRTWTLRQGIRQTRQLCWRRHRHLG
jgi:hypothetical protein